jgi:hypothetical protein
MRSALFRRLGISVVALLLVVGPALAQPAAPPSAPATAADSAKPSPAKIALARELIEATGAVHAFDPLLQNVLEQARRTILATHPDLENDLDASLRETEKAFTPQQNKLRETIAEIYAKHFSEDDLHKMLAFYRSPVGKKMVETTPLILRDSYTAARAWAQNLSVETMEHLRADMKKKGHDI